MTCNCIGGNPCPCQRGGMVMGRIVFSPAIPPYTMPPELAEAIEKARLHVMTPKEIYEQKVSWLMGMSGKLADPMPSRERIVKALAEMGVIDPQPDAAHDEGKTK